MKNNIDYKLFFAVVILIIFWTIMVSSVSVYWSFRVTELQARAWLIDQAYNYFYVIRNITHIAIWAIIFAFLVKVKYSYFEKYSKQIFWFNIFMLILVLILWITIYWAKRWIDVPWLPFTLQPAEFMKFWLIVFLAAFLKKYHWFLWDFKKWFLPFVWILWIVIFLLWLQPDFWMILITVPIAVMMYFYAGMNIKHLLASILLWFTLIFSVYMMWKYDKDIPWDRKKLSYITDRIDNFLDSSENAIKTKNINYQTEQALIAIWSWWFTWRWFWWSIQKFGYLPEVQWDFVFSVIIEELGFLWWMFLLSLYLYIAYRWYYIASRVKDKFWKFAAVWISSRILMQSFINIWVNLNILPLTWVTLPFISYWWSSLLSLMMWLALLLSISRDMEENNSFSRLNRNKIML